VSPHSPACKSGISAAELPADQVAFSRTLRYNRTQQESLPDWSGRAGLCPRKNPAVSATGRIQMSEVICKAAAMVAIIILGYVLKRIGFLSRDDFPVLSRIMINITLPCSIIAKFIDFQMDYSFLIFILFGLVLNLILISTGFLAGMPDKKRQAFFMINFSGYNIGSFTLPFIQEFLGTSGVVATCMFDAGNSVMCTGGTLALASTVADSGGKQGIGSFFKKLFSSVPTDVYLIMLLLSALRIHLPLFLSTLAKTAGNANAFLAMLVIGLGFEWNMQRSEIRDTFFDLVFRYGFSVLIALAFWNLLPFEREVRVALVLTCFSPISALAPSFTMKTGGSVAISSAINSVSIVMSVIIMTILLIVFHI
jgi:predicted permease